MRRASVPSGFGERRAAAASGGGRQCGTTQPQAVGGGWRQAAGGFERQRMIRGRVLLLGSTN